MKTLIVFFILAVSSLSLASTSGVTYQGRILKPDGSPLSGQFTQFKMQIRTPDAQGCLMYEEVQSQDLRNSNGTFSLTINDGSGSRTDTTGLPLDRIFANRGTFTLDVTTCATGTGTWIPNVSDGRNLIVLFKDETMTSWEPIPAQKINFVPYAFESKQIAGFTADSLLRVVNGSGDPLTGLAPLSNAQYTELMALVNGTSTAFTKLGGVPLPTMTTGEVLGWNGTAWVSQPAVAGPNSVTTSMIQAGAVDGTKIASGAVGTSQVASNVTINTSGTLGAAVTTTRDFKIFAASPSTFNIDMQAPALAASYSLVWPMDDGNNGEVLTTNGSGVLSWAPASAPSQWTTQAPGINYTGGYVGIGTTSPREALEITTANNPAIRLSEAASAATSYSEVQATGPGSLAISQTNNGNSIIGVDPLPNATGTSQVRVFRNVNSTGSKSFTIYRGDGTGTIDHDLQSGAAAQSYFAANGGNVGIGTTSPQTQLNVVGNGRFEATGSNGPALTVVNTAGGGATAPTVRVHKYGGAGWPYLQLRNAQGTESSPSATTTANPIGQIRFSGYGTTTTNDFAATITARAGATWADGDTPAALEFSTTRAGSSSSSVRLKIDSTGNLGVGVGTPTALLHLKAGTATASTAPLKFTSGTLLTTPEDGAMEYNSGSGLWFTIGSTRYVIPTNTAAGNYSNVSNISNTGGSITMTPAAGNSVIVNQSTVSTSSTTGALVVNGGVGVAGAVNAAGNITSGGSITATTNGVIPQLYGSTAAAGDIRIDGTSNASPGNVYLASAGGRVGIGTTSPNFLFDVAGTAHATSLRAGQTGSAGSLTLVGPAGSASSVTNFNSETQFFSAGTNTYYTFFTGDGGGTTAERLRITGAGNIGIGTTSPSTTLEFVSGDAVGGAGGLKFSETGTSGGYMLMRDNTTSANQFEPKLEAKSSGATRSFIIENDIQTSQDVGTTPALSFNAVYAGGAVTTRPLFDFQNFGSSKMTILANGYVGMGTAAPSYPLHVSNSAGVGLRVENTTSNASAKAGLDVTNNAGHSVNIRSFSTSFSGSGLSQPDTAAILSSPAVPLVIGTQSSHRLSFGTNDTERMRIDATGNVGIGTTSPTFKLEVNGNSFVNGSMMAQWGNAAAPSFVTTGGVGFFQPTANTFAVVTNTAERMRVDGSGNVGIGTTSPVATLNVQGAIVSNLVANAAGVVNINFTSGNVQRSANATNNQAFKICGLQDGGQYTLILTAQPNGSVPTFTAYSDAACTTPITDFDQGGVTFLVSSPTVILNFVRSGTTVYAMFASGFTK